MSLNWNFQSGGGGGKGVKPKKPSVGGVWIFSGTTQSVSYFFMFYQSIFY